MGFASFKNVFWTTDLLLKTNRVRSIYFTRRFSSKASGENEDLVTEVVNNIGIITLNRPKALNALDLPMIKNYFKKLTEWEDRLALVVARSSVNSAFCAGGDVFKMTEGGPKNCQYGKDMFRYSYTKVYIISQYKIPYISLTNGITMGAGVGISRSGKYCIATENSLFAMPETAVGLCPDVGASYFFSRLEGKLGLYLALTGQRLQGKDGVKIGFASHYIESKNIPKLFGDILKLKNGDVEGVINKYSQDMTNHTFSLAPNLELINEAFSAPTVEEIVERLRVDGSEFSKITLDKLFKMSPIALKATKVQVEKGESMTLKECIQMEYRVVTSACEATLSLDLYEGARALREKRKPRWNPANLEDVTDVMVNQLFLPISPDEELIL